MDIFKQIAEARAQQKRLKKGEKVFLALTDAMTEWVMDNADLFSPADIHSMCARLESAFTGMERLCANADGILDPTDIIQAREDVAELRRSMEARL